MAQLIITLIAITAIAIARNAKMHSPMRRPMPWSCDDSASLRPGIPMPNPINSQMISRRCCI
jgi:hypothetical protein